MNALELVQVFKDHRDMIVESLAQDGRVYREATQEIKKDTPALLDCYCEYLEQPNDYPHGSEVIEDIMFYRRMPIQRRMANELFEELLESLIFFEKAVGQEDKAPEPTAPITERAEEEN